MGKITSDGGPSAYYDFPEGSITLNDLIEHKQMSFAQGNIFKAAYRLGNKEGISLEYDLTKIIYYAARLMFRGDPKAIMRIMDAVHECRGEVPVQSPELETKVYGIDSLSVRELIKKYVPDELTLESARGIYSPGPRQATAWPQK